MSAHLLLFRSDMVKPGPAIGPGPVGEIRFPAGVITYHDLADIDEMIAAHVELRAMLASEQARIINVPEPGSGVQQAIAEPQQDPRGPHCFVAGCGGADCDCRQPCGDPACQAIDPGELEPLPPLPQRTGYECAPCQLGNCDDCHTGISITDEGDAYSGQLLACDCATAGHLRKPDDDTRAAAVIEGEPA